jgi:hypothetical protein
MSNNNLSANINSNAVNTKHEHVPYRESKLTRLLKDSLGGNGMTVLLACILTQPRSILRSNDTIAISLMRENAALKAQLAEFRSDKKTDSQVSIPSNSSNNESNFYEMSNLSLMTTKSIKNLLITCLEEGVFIDENELKDIQSDLCNTIRNILKIPIVKNEKIEKMIANNEILLDDLDNFNFMPPIMAAIEDVKLLQNEIHKIRSFQNENEISRESVLSENSMSKVIQEYNFIVIYFYFDLNRMKMNVKMMKRIRTVLKIIPLITTIMKKPRLMKHI